LSPIFEALVPAPAHSSDQNAGSWTRGYLHCGPPGAGHFVKMIHNGIEYAVMAAYAEGFNLLAHAGRGNAARTRDAETAPLADPEAYRYDFDTAAIAEVWRHGSVIRSWILDLTADALREDPKLQRFAGRVSDSGEGRWTLKAAIDLGVPMPTLASALFGRFTSRDEDTYANQLLSAMREQFGGHAEKKH
jgi:6-phosphogluconate dehydrogenase